jgi:GTP pyrophosphokinase
MATIEEVLAGLTKYHPSADTGLVMRAYELAAEKHEGQARASGEPYISHPLCVAMNVVELRLDDVSVAAALLHDVVEDTDIRLEELEALFGKEVANLVDGVTKLSHLQFSSKEEMQAENFRKMMLAMSKDIRVVLVKLADRLHNMRTLGFKTGPSVERIARETMEIYAPLANRLGIYSVKSDLEDLAFRYLEPVAWADLTQKVERVRREHERFIELVKNMLGEELRAANIQGEIDGRMKHLVSIHRKMKAQNIPFEEVYDLVAFRALVDTVNECWHVLGVVHQLWKPIPGRFRDYIDLPKPNGYKSLHTAVMGPNGEPMEIQVRTWKMHEVAERGIAAHWSYKEGTKASAPEQERVRMLKELLDGIRELHKDSGDSKEFLASMKEDLFGDEVFVFTPKGDVKVFPRGATPLDFAYQVHSEVGNHCSGAKINGTMVPLSFPMHNGDIVQILTSANQKPSEDWLSLVHTGGAKAKIRSYLRHERREMSQEVGRAVLEKQLRRKGLSLKSLTKRGDLERVLTTLGIPNEEELLVRLGGGRLQPRDVLRAFMPELDEQTQPGEEPKDEGIFSELIRKITPGTSPGTVLVGGEGDIVTHFAHCCSPLPGDRIVGFVNRSRGISVHRATCPSVADVSRDRLVDVQWDKGTKGHRLVKIKVLCLDQAGMLAAMSNVFLRLGVNIVSANCQGNRDKGATNFFEVLVEDAEHLKRLQKALESTSGILSVERV